MKKSKIIALVSAVSITAASVFTATSMAFAAPALGDVDSDGRISAKDARTILRHAAKLEMLDDSLLPTADVNGDDKVTAADARLVLRYASKLITEMGGEKKYDEITKGTDTSDTTATTKKIDLTTRPTTKPTTKPTEKTTAPATAPTTEPTTEPTTAEPTTKPGYDDNIPADIHSFTEGKFDFVGTIMTADGKQSVRFTNEGNQMRIGLSMNDIDLDLLKLVKKNLLKKDVEKYYLVSNEKKMYIELNDAVLKTMGIDPDQMSFSFAVVDISKAEYTTNVTTFNGKENIVCYTFENDNAKLNFYMDGDNLIGMENCDKDGNINQMMIFESFSGNVPSSRWSLDGYKEKLLLTDFLISIAK